MSSIKGMSRKNLRPDRRRDFFLEFQPTVDSFPGISLLGLSILSFSADGDEAVGFERAASGMTLRGQPRFYPRLVACGYFWLSERA
jgi:hypothetical protein